MTKQQGLFADGGTSEEIASMATKKGKGSKSRSVGAAERMAKDQREISVSEFFTKNRHLLGFDSPRKALLTAIKEAVDNSLDACEEAGILPELEIAMSAEDGRRYEVADGEWARLRSRRGDLEGRVLYTEKMEPGQVFVPFVKLQDHAANFLTNAALDPNSRIPEYKVCAVRLEKIGGESGAAGGTGRRRRKAQ